MTADTLMNMVNEYEIITGKKPEIFKMNKYTLNKIIHPFSGKGVATILGISVELDNLLENNTAYCGERRSFDSEG